MRIWTRKKNSLLLLSLLLLGVTIGYAALSTTLKVTGTTNIGKNTWSIYWDNVANQSGVTTTTPVISNDATNGPNTVVTWTVTLDQPGDFYEFTVDAVNAGTLDAMITSIEHKLNGSAISNNNKLPDYVHYSVTYANGDAIALNQLLPKATVSGNTTVFTRETYKVRVEFDSDIEPEDLSDVDQTFQLSFGVTYGQADDNGINAHPVFILPQGKTKDNLALGDEVCINGTTTECFNVVKYNGNDVVMLAKWNLNVDGYTTAYGGTATNIQNSEVRGEWNDGGTMKDYGRVEFSEAVYWYEWDGAAGIKPKYNASNYPVNVYDPDYDSARGETDYSIAYYVKAYKNILTGNGYGAPIKEARLLTYDEATTTLGCTAISVYESGSCPTAGAAAFAANTDYWLGSAGNSQGEVYRVLFNRILNGTNSGYHGVRPVIVVEKSNL